MAELPEAKGCKSEEEAGEKRRPWGRREHVGEAKGGKRGERKGEQEDRIGRGDRIPGRGVYGCKDREDAEQVI